MHYCRLCVTRKPINVQATSLNDNVKAVIEMFFFPRIIIDPNIETFVCGKCQMILLHFYEYYHKVLGRQEHYFMLLGATANRQPQVKIEPIEIKQEPEELVIDVTPIPNIMPPSPPQPLPQLQVLDPEKQEEDVAIKNIFKLICTECEEEFDKYDELLDHTRSIHFKPSFVIECCSVKLNSRHKVLEHALKHSGHEISSCTACGKQFFSKSYLRLHMLRHGPVENYKFHCEECGERFVNSVEMNKHSYSHLSDEVKANLKPHPCKVCKKTFVLMSGLRAHMRHVHENSFKGSCSICKKKFRSQTTLSTHMSVVHASKVSSPPFQCDFCSAIYETKPLLKKHINNCHGIEVVKKKIEYSCDLCTNTFKSKSAMSLHRKRMHSVNKKTDLTQRKRTKSRQKKIKNVSNSKNK